MRRVAAVQAVVSGIVLIAVPFAYSMFDRTSEAERILDRFEFLTLGDNPDRYLAEAETTRDGSSELVDAALPTLAAEAGVGEAGQALRYPALGDAQQVVPEVFEFSVRYSEQLEAVEDKFQSVYDIPVAWIPLTATPWFFLLAGLACLIAGVVALRSPGRRGTAAIFALGVVLALGPIAFGALGKSTDGEDVKDFATNGLAQRAADAAQEASTALDGVVAETEQRILPQLARERLVAEADLDAELERRFPASGEFLAEWDVIGPRLSELADAVSASVQEFESAKQLPISFPVWLLIGAGLAMVVAAGLGLLHRPAD